MTDLEREVIGLRILVSEQTAIIEQLSAKLLILQESASREIDRIADEAIQKARTK